MASEVTICNRALAYCGERPVLSLNEETVAAGLCKSLYPEIRDEVQAAYDWSACRAQRELAQSTDAPAQAFYNAAYLKPSDALSVHSAFRNVEGGGEFEHWDVLGKYVYVKLNSNAVPGSIWVGYSARVTDPTLFGAMLTSVIVARLAAELAIPLTESERKRTAMWRLYEQKLQEALGSDGIQGRTRITTNRQLTQVRGRRGSEAFVTRPPLDFGG